MGKSPFYAERKFDERLRMFMVFVLAEIDTYDYDCTKRSRGKTRSPLKNLLRNAMSGEAKF